MTFLQLTQGRLEATSIGHQADEEAHVAALAAVRSQLIDVLGLPLLALEWTPIDHGHALMALDPSGQVVTVEVLRELGPAGLLAALVVAFTPVSVLARTAEEVEAEQAQLEQEHKEL